MQYILLGRSGLLDDQNSGNFFYYNYSYSNNIFIFLLGL